MGKKCSTHSAIICIFLQGHKEAVVIVVVVAVRTARGNKTVSPPYFVFQQTAAGDGGHLNDPTQRD